MTNAPKVNEIILPANWMEDFDQLRNSSECDRKSLEFAYTVATKLDPHLLTEGHLEKDESGCVLQWGHFGLSFFVYPAEEDTSQGLEQFIFWMPMGDDFERAAHTIDVSTIDEAAQKLNDIFTNQVPASHANALKCRSQNAKKSAYSL